LSVLFWYLREIWFWLPSGFTYSPIF